MKVKFITLLIICLFFITEVYCDDDDDNMKEEDSKDLKKKDDADELSDEEKEAKIQHDIQMMNENTKKQFESHFDTSEDYNYENMDNFQSGQYNDAFTEDQKISAFAKLVATGPIIELLEPKARQFNNIPQSKNKVKRIDCKPSDGSQKAHFLTVQSSKNFFEWRVKRSSKNANCTMRISVDGENFIPLKPTGVESPNKFSFACGRTAGYESVQYDLPKNIVAEKGAVMQFEWEHKDGVIVQCADVIIQKYNQYQHTNCEPACKNGGVCQNGVCKCGTMYSGETCEDRMDSSGFISFMMYIFIIALFLVGIYLLKHQAQSRQFIKEYYQKRDQQRANQHQNYNQQVPNQEQYDYNDGQNYPDQQIQ